jgi:hypothetical protein
MVILFSDFFVLKESGFVSATPLTVLMYNLGEHTRRVDARMNVSNSYGGDKLCLTKFSLNRSYFGIVKQLKR